MATQKPDGYELATKLVDANKSPRYRRLEALESWFDCEQYRGRVNWWNDSVPQWEREPCIVYPVVRMAASSNVDLMLGERAFPRFVFESDKKADDDSENQTSIEAALADFHRAGRFKTTCREAFFSAQSMGSVCAVYGVRDGRPFGDLVPAKWCEPEFFEGTRVKRLVIQYPYLDEFQKPDGSWEVRAMVYRRVIDGERDIAYKPAEAPESNAKIKWSEDKERTVAHNFGFCPVVWYPFMRGCAAVNVIDGKAIHDGLTDEIQAHDIARSQWHTTALYSSPQPYEVGVSADHNPTGETGHTAVVPATEHGGESHPDGNRVHASYVTGPGRKPARKKGMGYVWRFPDPETKVGYLQTSSDAVKAQSDNVANLRQLLQEALSVVFIDPDNIKFAATTSGKALEAIKQKQIDRVDQYREDFRDGFLIPSLEMQLRIAQKAKVRIPSASVLKRADPDMVEFDLTVQWGSYSAPDFGEQKQIIELVQLALGGSNGRPVIDLRTAVQKLQNSDLFEIESTDKLVEILQAKDEEDASSERELIEIARGARGGTEARPEADGGGGSSDSATASASGQEVTK